MIGAVIQARMNSSRLPGKVLRKVAGRPLLEFLLERLAASQRIEKIVLATSLEHDDNEIAACGGSFGVPVYRGSQEDVLDRFYQAAQKHDMEHVVRLTGDCPLIDPGICDRLIDFYLDRKVDYAALSPGFAEGLDCEVVSFAALARSHREAELRSEREHVTLYVRNHPEFFSSLRLENNVDDSRFRVTVDDPEDLEVVSAVISHFAALSGRCDAPWQQVKAFLAQHPHIAAINAHIERNEGLRISLANDGKA